jgi:hypothetical protein
VERVAGRLAPDNVRWTHQSVHHVVADAPWSDEEVLAGSAKLRVDGSAPERDGAGVDRG